MFFSCKKKNPQQESIYLEVESNNAKILSKYFSKAELDKILSIKSKFDNKLCSTYNHNRILSECYKFSSHSLKSDFLSGYPIQLNFPFDNTMPLNSLTDTTLSQIWSFKCGFIDKFDNTIFNFYCLNINGKVGDYLKRLGNNNNLIKEFFNSYSKHQDFHPDIQQQIILSAQDKLEFSNIDHQIFWMLYCLSLNETITATKKVNEKQTSEY